MQFGIFSVSDITTDPTTGRTPSEAERIQAIVAIAQKAEEVGLDVFALGEHHNPPFFSSSPTTALAYIAARTQRLQLSTATTLITTNDPVKIAEGQRDGTVRSGSPRHLAQYVGGLVLAQAQVDPEITGSSDGIPLEDFLDIVRGALAPPAS